MTTAKAEMNDITPGTKVLYHNDSQCLGGGVWSGVVTRVMDCRNLGQLHWAWVTFDGVVVPDNCAHGIAGPAMGRDWDTVLVRHLTLRQPCIDDAAQSALWAKKVVALDEQKRAAHVAAQQAHAQAQMAAFSHFRAGQTVTWSHMIGMGWGPQPDSYAPYTGTITAIDLPGLTADVMGARQRLHHDYPAPQPSPMKVALSLLQPVACSCGIACTPGYYCGSAAWLSAASAASRQQKNQQKQ